MTTHAQAIESWDQERVNWTTALRQYEQRLSELPAAAAERVDTAICEARLALETLTDSVEQAREAKGQEWTRRQSEIERLRQSARDTLKHVDDAFARAGKA